MCFGSNRSHSVNLSPTDEVFENVEETDIIEQLEQRRAELAMMALDKEVEVNVKCTFMRYKICL